jgi:hypothetical protein
MLYFVWFYVHRFTDCKPFTKLYTREHLDWALALYGKTWPFVKTICKNPKSTISESFIMWKIKLTWYTPQRGYFEGVKLSWMLKFWNIHGKKLMVHVGRIIKIAVILTFVSKYFVAPFPTTKTTILLPLKNTHHIVVVCQQCDTKHDFCQAPHSPKHTYVCTYVASI